MAALRKAIVNGCHRQNLEGLVDKAGGGCMKGWSLCALSSLCAASCHPKGTMMWAWMSNSHVMGQTQRYQLRGRVSRCLECQVLQHESRARVRAQKEQVEFSHMPHF